MYAMWPSILSLTEVCLLTEDSSMIYYRWRIYDYLANEKWSDLANLANPE